jgi:hypothetical protein
MTDIDPSDPTRNDIVESVERQVSLLTKELADTILRIDCAACRANLVEYVRVVLFTIRFAIRTRINSVTSMR